MPRDGQGVYNLEGTPLVDGAIAEATGSQTALQPKLDDIADALTDSLAADGQTLWTGNQNAAGHKLTGLLAATVAGDAVRFDQLTGLSSVYQPLDPQLSAWAIVSPANGDMFYWTNATTLSAVSTTPGGRSVLTLPDPDADRILFFDDSAGLIAHLSPGSGLAIDDTTLKLDDDLVALAGLATTSFGRTFLTLADGAAARTLIGAEIGTDVQAFDATLAELASYNMNGILVQTQTSPQQFIGRSITSGSGISVSNGDGVGNNPQISVDSTVVLTTGAQTIGGAKTFSAGMTLTGFGISGALTKSDAQPTFLWHEADGASPHLSS